MTFYRPVLVDPLQVSAVTRLLFDQLSKVKERSRRAGHRPKGAAKKEGARP